MAAVSGCGGGEPQASPSTITVTVPPSPPSGARPATDPASPPTSAEPTGGTVLPRIERGFDAAFVSEWREQGDGIVLSIDRLTVAGLSDDELAAQGAPVAVHQGERFTNQNVRLYDAGVSTTARFVLTTCQDSGSGPALTSLPVSAEDFLASPGLPSTPVLIRYTDGLVERIETNPSC